MANFKKCFRKIKKMSDEDRSVELLADHFSYKLSEESEKRRITSPYLDGLVLWISGVPFCLDIARLRRSDGPMARQKLSQALAEWHAEEDRGNILNWV